MGRVHAQAIAERLPEFDLAAVAEERDDAVEAASALIGEAAVYSTVADALAHPKIDACLVVTPTETHAEVVDVALDRGLHVFCEKPLTLDLNEARRLDRQAQQAGRVLQVGFWRRFCPVIVEAKARLDRGDVGRPIFARSSQWDAQAPLPDWCSPSRSGGIFVDMGVHDLDQLEWLLGDFVIELEGRAFEIADPAIGAVGDYDNAAMFLRFAEGTRALIDLSRNGRYADDLRIEILGTEGALFIDTFPGSRLRVGGRTGLETVWDRPGQDAFLTGVAGEIAAFGRAVRDPGSERVPGARESVRATYLGETARASARSQTALEATGNTANTDG
jgi:predicted dehydrogenase